ncbi:Cystathionine beta-synthase [Yarrowia sp. C11]|nr:Cystathionine beta-synthase [Yarrowia sp. C11]KAG5370930.1 Cystathionine beta-synthase [Yarrowia sp. E02]
MAPKHNYRGATVEDLEFPPAFSVTPQTSLIEALELSYEKEYSYLPVISGKNRALLGYLTADQLRQQSSRSSLDGSVPVASVYNKFHKDASRPFKPITPATPLEQLEDFFESGQPFAVVTDDSRQFVLGVVVKEDLEKYIKCRPELQ